MYFDYAGYVRECLNIPLEGLILFDILGMVVIIIGYFNLKNYFPKKQLILLVLILILSSIKDAYEDAGQLLHGGIYLLWEKESDAVGMQGKITEITELDNYSLPRIECDYYENLKYGDPKGYEFTINSIQCTAPVKGSLKVGDYVSVTYLPKSGYVLYIDRVEQ